jgi:flagellar basal-body rod protein FlgB
MLSDLFESGAMPTLEMSVRFAGQRQRLIAHNIANIDTPGFTPQDVSVSDFRKALSDAVDDRRQRNSGPMQFKGTRELRVGPNGSLRLEPRTSTPGVLFHDRANRDVERLMQDQAENILAFRVATDLLKGRFDLMKMAIRGRE